MFWTLLRVFLRKPYKNRIFTFVKSGIPLGRCWKHKPAHKKPSKLALSGLCALEISAWFRAPLHTGSRFASIVVARFKIGHTPRKNRLSQPQPPASSHICRSHASIIITGKVWNCNPFFEKFFRFSAGFSEPYFPRFSLHVIFQYTVFLKIYFSFCGIFWNFEKCCQEQMLLAAKSNFISLLLVGGGSLIYQPARTT